MFRTGSAVQQIAPHCGRACTCRRLAIGSRPHLASHRASRIRPGALVRRTLDSAIVVNEKEGERCKRADETQGEK